MNYNKLRDCIKEKKFTIEDIANRIDMTREGLSRSLGEGKMKIDVFEKICEVIEVHPSIFFDDTKFEIGEGNIVQLNNGNGNKQHIIHNENEYELLRKLLEEKERTIQILLNKG